VTGFGGFVGKCCDGCSLGVSRMCRDRFTSDPIETQGHVA
jgi:hypothetical protein